jgi:hypothetical protein
VSRDAEDGGLLSDFQGEKPVEVARLRASRKAPESLGQILEIGWHLRARKSAEALNLAWILRQAMDFAPNNA